MSRGKDLLDGLESELMGLPGDLSTGTTSVDFTAGHSANGAHSRIPLIRYGSMGLAGLLKVYST